MPKRQDSGSSRLSATEASSVPLKELVDLYVLDSIKGFGPQKFKELHKAGVKPSAVLDDPTLLPIPGKTGDKFRENLLEMKDKDLDTLHDRAERQLAAAEKHGGAILTYSHPLYPKNVYDSNNPIPILYVRGAPEVLRDNHVVATVGSRKVREPYSRFETAFTKEAVKLGWTIVSGFAQGADAIGHTTAFKEGGRTICVMPGGLDRPFPPEHKGLWDELLQYQAAVFVSEFAFGTRAAALTLRKRNKLIVAFALGVLVAQSAQSGGAMNAYRFAVEQRKPLATFQSDAKEDTSGNFEIEQKITEQLLNTGQVFTGARSTEYGRWLQTLSSSM
jgi:DNA protecting protein DprA